MIEEFTYNEQLELIKNKVELNYYIRYSNIYNVK